MYMYTQVAVSELPGYPGRQHTQQSRYVTAEFLEAISTIHQNFTWVMPGSGTTYICAHLLCMVVTVVHLSAGVYQHI